LILGRLWKKRNKIKGKINPMDIDKMIYEAQQRLSWYINGIGIHGLSPELFSRLSTERIVEIYNVEMSFFTKTGK
jgi:hypothetical protein